MPRIAAITTAVALFVAAAAGPAGAATSDGTSNTIFVAGIAQSKLAEASQSYFFKSAGGLKSEPESFMDYTDDA
jgi:hypothetical protein